MLTLKNCELFGMEALDDCIQGALAKNGDEEQTTTDG